MRHHRVRSDREGWREGGREGGREGALSTVLAHRSVSVVRFLAVGVLALRNWGLQPPPCLSCLLCMLAILIFPFFKFEKFDLLVYYRGWPASLPYIRENPRFRCDTHSIQNPCSQKGTYGQNMSVLKNDQNRIT